jgi:hypothetical protein
MMQLFLSFEFASERTEDLLKYILPALVIPLIQVVSTTSPVVFLLSSPHQLGVVLNQPVSLASSTRALIPRTRRSFMSAAEAQNYGGKA